MRKIRLIRWIAAAALLAACNMPVTPAPDSTSTMAALPTSTSPAATSASTPTEPVPMETAATQSPGETSPIPTEPGSAGTAQVISPENATGLAAHILELPDYPERLLWPEPGQLNQAPEADLLLQAGPYLHPVVLLPDAADSGALGEPVILPMDGNTILAFAPDASFLLVQDADQLGLFNPNGERLHVIEHPAPYGASFSPDGKFLVITSSDHWGADIYNTATGEPITQLTGFETAAPVYNTVIAPGGETAVWIARATVQIQEVASGTMGKRLEFEDFVGAFTFSPDGGQLAVSAGNRLEIYTLPSGERLAETTLSQPLSDLAYSPDGRILAGAYGPSIQLWNPQSLSPIHSLAATAFSSRVSFSPDGRFLVSVHEENQLAIWTTR